VLYNSENLGVYPVNGNKGVNPLITPKKQRQKDLKNTRQIPLRKKNHFPQWGFAPLITPRKQKLKIKGEDLKKMKN